MATRNPTLGPSDQPPRLAVIRRALLKESANPLKIFVLRAGFSLKIALEIELRIEPIGGRSRESPLHQPVGLGRAGCEPFRSSRASPIKSWSSTTR